MTTPSPPRVAPAESSAFDARYYATGCGLPYERNEAWLHFFGLIADRILSDIRPASVLDAGCAMGFLVEALRERDVPTWGVDISPYAIHHVHPGVREFCRVGSVVEPFERRFDLIVCIEVLEHLPKAEGERAIANLCNHADDVLFSSTPSDFTEATHVNVQSAEYWAEQFARGGLFHDLDFDASFVTPWALRFRRRDEPAHRLVREYERRLARVKEENQQLRVALNDARADLDAAQLRAERDALRDLVQQYESGKFMRFMRWLKGVRP